MRAFFDNTYGFCDIRVLCFDVIVFNTTVVSFIIVLFPISNKIHDNEHILSREVIINGLVGEKGTFDSSFEADNSKLQNVYNHMDETTPKIDSTRRLGKAKGDIPKP